MEPEGSLPHSQVLTNCPYFEKCIIIIIIIIIMLLLLLLLLLSSSSSTLNTRLSSPVLLL